VVVSEEIQVIIEILFKNKSVGEDVPGLLSLIMFSGISGNEDLYFKNHIIDTLYLSDTTNACYELQHNLCDLLFGITADDVSQMLIL
jgi:hypothetical protein